MQQFVVPQFIDIEDKVIGPITVRQFIIILIGGGLCFVAYKLSDLVLFLIEFIVIVSLTVGLAFIKVNGKPIHYLILNIIQTFKKPKVRVWQRLVTTQEVKSGFKAKEEIKAAPQVKYHHVRASRLAELSLIVDTGGVYQGEANKLSDEELI